MASYAYKMDQNLEVCLNYIDSINDKMKFMTYYIEDDSTFNYHCAELIRLCVEFEGFARNEMMKRKASKYTEPGVVSGINYEH